MIRLLLKDLKKAETIIKNSEARVEELLAAVNKNNKKISELNNAITRLTMMKDQAKDAVNIKLKENKKETVVDHAAKKTKCRYENTGICRSKSECQDVHPKKTCQSHSKMGSCPMESTCEHRHPYGVCYDYEKYGSCHNGDICRHRHPIELSRPGSSDPFLGYGSPGRQEAPGGQGQGSHWSPGQGHRHHDQRGNRW